MNPLNELLQDSMGYKDPMNCSFSEHLDAGANLWPHQLARRVSASSAMTQLPKVSAGMGELIRWQRSLLLQAALLKLGFRVFQVRLEIDARPGSRIHTQCLRSP